MSRTVKARWLALQDDGLSPSADVAEVLRCSDSYVQYLRRQSVSPPDVRCSHCGFLDDEKIPIGDDGVCLWCREIVAGRDPRDLYDSGTWQAETDWRGDHDPGDLLRQALRDRIVRDGQGIVGAAAQIGVTEAWLGNFLRGRGCRLDRDKIDLLVRYLDISVEQVRELLA